MDLHQHILCLCDVRGMCVGTWTCDLCGVTESRSMASCETTFLLFLQQLQHILLHFDDCVVSRIYWWWYNHINHESLKIIFVIVDSSESSVSNSVQSCTVHSWTPWKSLRRVNQIFR